MAADAPHKIQGQQDKGHGLGDLLGKWHSINFFMFYSLEKSDQAELSQKGKGYTMPVKGLGASVTVTSVVRNSAEQNEDHKTHADMCELLCFPVHFSVPRMKPIIQDSCKWLCGWGD